MKSFFCLSFFLMVLTCGAQDTIVLRNQYEAKPEGLTIINRGVRVVPDSSGNLIFLNGMPDRLLVYGELYDSTVISTASLADKHTAVVEKKFSWSDLLTPMFYIMMGGIWFILFIVFAETGLFIGFFLPGDSLLFVTGIYSHELVRTGLGLTGIPDFVDLLILGALISLAGILGNMVGYWFGRKSGPYLFEKKDSFLFRKKYLLQARDFYDKHGGTAIVIARFLPIIRTFAPIVAGIVGMERKKFTYYNIVGCIAWVFSMLIAGHYLQKLFYKAFDFNLKDHLEVIVLGIVAITTLPIIWKLFLSKKPLAESKPTSTEV